MNFLFLFGLLFFFFFIIHIYRWLALFLSLKAAYRLHHQRLFGLEEEDQGESRDLQRDRERSQPRSKCLSHKDLILWLNRPTSYPNTHTSPVLQVRNTQNVHIPTKIYAQKEPHMRLCARQVKLK